MSDSELANQYLDAGEGAKAMKIFYRLAEEGRLSAMHSIAHSHLYGIAGVKQDYNEAFKWFSRGAAGGCPQAMYHLGLCNAEGYGTPKNPELALDWWKKSADHGDEDSTFRVGDCYERGFGTKANRAEAIKWYRRAAADGQEEAQARLKALGEK